MEMHKKLGGNVLRSPMADGWDTAVVGGALANIGDALGHVLDDVEQEWAVASLSAGAIAGTLIGGALSDK